MTLYEKLLMVQSSMNCPKNQLNKFGGYSFRSCEDILEAAKPVLKEAKAALTVGDDLVMIGNRYYVKATATFIDTESGETITNTAFAREAEDKKGMDPSQITGCASSYARKYALNGLLCLDDNKDADSMDNSPAPKGLSPELISSLKEQLARTGISEKSMLKNYGATSIVELSLEDYENAIGVLKSRPDKQKAVDALSGKKQDEYIESYDDPMLPLD